jgi:hypothetical protein
MGFEPKPLSLVSVTVHPFPEPFLGSTKELHGHVSESLGAGYKRNKRRIPVKFIDSNVNHSHQTPSQKVLKTVRL